MQPLDIPIRSTIVCIAGLLLASCSGMDAGSGDAGNDTQLIRDTLVDTVHDTGTASLDALETDPPSTDMSSGAPDTDPVDSADSNVEETDSADDTEWRPETDAPPDTDTATETGESVDSDLPSTSDHDTGKAVDTASGVDSALLDDSDVPSDTGGMSDSATAVSTDSDSSVDTRTGDETDSSPDQETESPPDTEPTDDTGTQTSLDTTDPSSDTEERNDTDSMDTDSDAAFSIKGLCVIADFSDQALEDLEGNGIRTESDIAPLLREMEAHWAWLSRGRESIAWETLRVTLPEPFTADAFAGWVEYRDAVVALALAEIDIADYDADEDGDVDAVWIIASNNGEDHDYLIGGASFNAGAHVFVDGQASESINRAAYGNFNHELGHLRGLPDLYGDYTTVNNLTLMAYSWATPPHDFGAYERTILGWVEPTVIDETTADVVLPSANDTFAAVKVPTARPHEYFLLEYRVTPEAGYGSQAPALDGLLVYHILEGSHQGQDPPLLKVAPADGVLGPGTTADASDVLSPDNPAMSLPFVAHTYAGGEPVFQIDNLAWVAGGIEFDVTILPHGGEDTNLVVNGSFEEGDVEPDAWTTSAWQATGTTYTWPSDISHSGARSVAIESNVLNDARWEQVLSGLEVGQAYEACAWLRGADIAGDGGFTGGNVSVVWTDTGGSLAASSSGNGLGTFDFRHACATFQAEVDTATVECRLGHWGSAVTGILWCDDVTVQPLYSAF